MLEVFPQNPIIIEKTCSICKLLIVEALEVFWKTFQQEKRQKNIPNEKETLKVRNLNHFDCFVVRRLRYRYITVLAYFCLKKNPLIESEMRNALADDGESIRLASVRYGYKTLKTRPRSALTKSFNPYLAGCQYIERIWCRKRETKTAANQTFRNHRF